MKSIPVILATLAWRRFLFAAMLVSFMGFKLVRGDDDRQPIPAAAALQKAAVAVAEVFGLKSSGDYTPDERKAVARAMLAVLPSAKDFRIVG